MISLIKRLMFRNCNLYERDMQFVERLQTMPQVKRHRNRH